MEIVHHPFFFKLNLLTILLLGSSLLGYLEWGGGNHTFIYQALAEIVLKLLHSPQSQLHPFVIFPLLGQLLLIISLFVNKRKQQWVVVGMICIAALFVFMFVIGLIGLKFKITISTIPFLVIAWLVFLHLKRFDNEKNPA